MPARSPNCQTGQRASAVPRLRLARDWFGSCWTAVEPLRAAAARGASCPTATLTISSRNYSSWSLRGWLLCRMAGLDFEEEVLPLDDPSTPGRAPAAVALVPRAAPQPRRASRSGTRSPSPSTWTRCSPEAGLLPADPIGARALPVDLRRDAFGLQQSALGAADEPQGALPGLQGLGRRPGRHRSRHRRSGATAWRAYGGPFLFGGLSVADAMYAPVCTRFLTYDVALECRRGRVPRPHPGLAASRRMDRGGERRAARKSRSSRSSSSLDAILLSGPRRRTDCSKYRLGALYQRHRRRHKKGPPRRTAQV